MNTQHTNEKLQCKTNLGENNIIRSKSRMNTPLFLQYQPGEVLIQPIPMSNAESVEPYFRPGLNSIALGFTYGVARAPESAADPKACNLVFLHRKFDHDRSPYRSVRE
jgi:hypothetical protein